MNPNAPCLMQLLVESTRDVRPTKAQAESFKAILTMPDHCGKETGPALEWARSRKEWSALLPEKDGTLTRLLSVPLLQWGIQQPWAQSIPVDSVMHFWFGRAVSKRDTMDDTAMTQAWALRAVRACVENPLAPPDRARYCCVQWSYFCDKNAALWNFPFVHAHNQTRLQEAWIDMGVLASPHLTDLEAPNRSLQKTWLLRMSQVFKGMPTEQQSSVLLLVLESALAKTMQIALCKKASPLSWTDPRVHALLRPLLPVQDYACYPELPWTKMQPHLNADKVRHTNAAIAHLYCPTLAPAFTIAMGSEEWTDRETACRVALLGRPSNTACDKLPVDDLVI